MAVTRRALVVDDIALNRMIAEEALKKLGWTVLTAADGQEALAGLEKMHCDVVLLDISMPGMGGVEVCQHIRSRADLGHTDVPVIAYTAHAQPEDRDKFIASGFNEVLIKPLNLERLTSVISYVTQHN